jgi:sigma-E factor negative regulatory protein RseA
MTDPIHEQISAFLDGELPAAESELLLKRLQRDAHLRNAVGRYSLIGEALRSTEAGGPTRDFAERVSRAIEQEAAPGKGWRPVASWLKPVAGGAIAAGVAAVALVSLRIAPVATQSNEFMTAAVEAPSMPVVAAPVARSREVLPSDTVPVSAGNFPAPPIQVINNGRLANFVMAHSEYSSPLGRPNVLTGLLAEEAIEQNDPANWLPASPPTQDEPTNKSRRALATR